MSFRTQDYILSIADFRVEEWLIGKNLLISQSGWQSLHLKNVSRLFRFIISIYFAWICQSWLIFSVTYIQQMSVFIHVSCYRRICKVTRLSWPCLDLRSWFLTLGTFLKYLWAIWMEFLGAFIYIDNSNSKLYFTKTQLIVRTIYIQSKSILTNLKRGTTYNQTLRMKRICSTTS